MSALPTACGLTSAIMITWSTIKVSKMAWPPRLLKPLLHRMASQKGSITPKKRNGDGADGFLVTPYVSDQTVSFLDK